MMASWEDTGAKCFYCDSINTTVRGFTKGPKEMHFWCHDCGLIAHHDAKTDVYRDNKPWWDIPEGIINPILAFTSSFYEEEEE
jgi:hypothetical protein